MSRSSMRQRRCVRGLVLLLLVLVLTEQSMQYVFGPDNLSSTHEQATSAVYPCSSTDGGALCKIAVYAEKLNLRSFWSGSWLSLWEVAPGEEGGALRISGSVSIRAHYFEDGNVQMQTSKVAPPQALDTVRHYSAIRCAQGGRYMDGVQPPHHTPTLTCHPLNHTGGALALGRRGGDWRLRVGPPG